MIVLAPSPLGREALDGPDACPAPVARATLRDIARSNALFGGRRAAAFGLRALFAGQILPERPLTLLDLGAGSGDVAAHLTRRARAIGIELRPIAAEMHRVAAHICRERALPTICADAAALPFDDRAVDIVLVSQVLHHFTRRSATQLVEALHRLARIGVIVADLRRTPLATAGIWLASVLLGFHPVTRRDGVLSVRRGFTTGELAEVLAAARVPPRVHRRPGFRIVAAWRTGDAYA